MMIVLPAACVIDSETEDGRVGDCGVFGCGGSKIVPRLADVRETDLLLRQPCSAHIFNVEPIIIEVALDVVVCMHEKGRHPSFTLQCVLYRNGEHSASITSHHCHKLRY